VLVMENIFYDRQISRIYDLKGSERSRYGSLAAHMTGVKLHGARHTSRVAFCQVGRCRLPPYYLTVLGGGGQGFWAQIGLIVASLVMTAARQFVSHERACCASLLPVSRFNADAAANPQDSRAVHLDDNLRRANLQVGTSLQSHTTVVDLISLLYDTGR